MKTMGKRVSIDEFMEKRKSFVRKAGASSTEAVIKGFRAPSSWDGDKRTGRFVMSTENKDRDGDIIRQAGLDLTEFLENPIAPAFHDMCEFPLGKWEDVTKLLTGRPKRTEGTLRLLPEGVDEECDLAAAHLSFGTIRACSIGFMPGDIEYRDKDEGEPENYWGFYGFDIITSTLLECSLVSVPANADALAKSAVAKGRSPIVAKAIIEEILDTWVKTPAGVIMPRAEYEQAYFAVTGKAPTTTVVLKGNDESATDHSQDDHGEEPGWFKRFLAKAGDRLVEEAARINVDTTALVQQEARLIEATDGGEPEAAIKAPEPVDVEALRARGRAVLAIVGQMPGNVPADG